MPQLTEAGEWLRLATETTLFCADSTLPALAVPDERRWRSIPARHRVLQPGDQLLRCCRMLSAQGSVADDALHRFGHIQPRAADWGVQRHDPMCEQPGNHVGAQVSGQVVPDQQQSEWW